MSGCLDNANNKRRSKMTRQERKYKAEKLLNAVATFELLNSKFKDYNDPIVGVATSIIRRMEPDYTDEELREVIDTISNIYDDNNYILNSTADARDEKQKQQELDMKRRYCDEYREINMMGMFPW